MPAVVDAAATYCVVRWPGEAVLSWKQEADMATWEYGRVMVSVTGSAPEYDPFPLGGPFGQPPVLLTIHIDVAGDLTMQNARVEAACARLVREGWEAQERYHLAPERVALVFRRPVNAS
jgi:hypothetical protein